MYMYINQKDRILHTSVFLPFWHASGLSESNTLCIYEVIPVSEVNTAKLQRFKSKPEENWDWDKLWAIHSTIQSEPVAPNFGENALRGNKIFKESDLGCHALKNARMTWE